MAMPDTIGGMGGANIQLNARNDSAAGAYKRKKGCKCWLTRQNITSSIKCVY